jgi:NagD protein
MDTDVIAGIEAEVDTVLVLSGVSNLENIKQFAYRPSHIMKGLDELVKLLK